MLALCYTNLKQAGRKDFLHPYLKVIEYERGGGWNIKCWKISFSETIADGSQQL